MNQEQDITITAEIKKNAPLRDIVAIIMQLDYVSDAWIDADEEAEGFIRLQIELKTKGDEK